MIPAISNAISGLRASALRIAASASNVANAQTVGAVPDANGKIAPGAAPAYTPLAVQQTSSAGGGVRSNLREDTSRQSLVYSPDSPFANTDGYVQSPGVDLGAERVSQIEASAAYRANIAALKVADDMERALLDIKG